MEKVVLSKVVHTGYVSQDLDYLLDLNVHNFSEIPVCIEEIST